MQLYTWMGSVAGSLESMWYGVIGFLPSLIVALLVLIIGLIVAAGLGALVEKIFEAIRLDSFLSKLGLAPFFERAGMRLRGARFLGQLVNWFLIITFFLAVADILRLSTLSGFLYQILLYIPNIIVAVLVMLASIVLANFLKRIVAAAVMGAKLHGAHFLGNLTWWAVVLFGIFAALLQLDVAAAIVQALVYGLVGMLALAGGLAFGLGGRDYASYLIGKLRDMERK